MGYQSRMQPIFNAKCPYYVTESKGKITCEGILTNSTNCKKFDDEDDKAKYIKEHCCNYPNNCPLSVFLDAKFFEEY